MIYALLTAQTLATQAVVSPAVDQRVGFTVDWLYGHAPTGAGRFTVFHGAVGGSVTVGAAVGTGLALQLLHQF